MTKKCNRCATQYPATTEHFYVDCKKSDGLATLCKKCAVPVRHAYYAAHQRTIRQQRSLHKKAHRARYNEYGRLDRKRLRQEMLQAYGSRCVCCGEPQPEFLTLEHIQGGGSQHRRSCGGSTETLYRALRRMGWPKDKYTLLCWNCNLAKAIYGQCPHELARIAKDLLQSVGVHK